MEKPKMTKNKNKTLSDQDLMLKCVELILDKSELSDQKLMLKSIELILSKASTRHINDVIEESQKLFDFIKKQDTTDAKT